MYTIFILLLNMVLGNKCPHFKMITFVSTVLRMISFSRYSLSVLRIV